MDDKLIRLTLTPMEALTIAAMIDAALEDLLPQADQLDQDQRYLLQTMQNLKKYLPVIK